MSQFPQPGLQAPGTQIGGRPVPRISQLVGVITGEARAAVGAEGTTAAQLVQSGRARVQQVRAMDASRARTAQVKQQAESTIAEFRARQRQEQTQIKAMNMLMSENADNPEWLARHATAEFRNATTASEKQIWMGVIGRANQLREQNNITAEREQQHSRKQQYNLAQETSRLQISRLQGELETNTELRRELIGNGEDIHDRLLEYVVGTIGEAVPALGDIRRSDPQFEFKTQLRDDLILSISQSIAPFGNNLIRQHRDQLDNQARTSAEHSFSAAIDSLILDLSSNGTAGAVSAVQDYVNTIDETELFSGLDTSGAERTRIEGQIRLNAAQQIGTLPDGITARTAAAALDELIRMPDGSIHPRAREMEDTFAQAFENHTQRRVNRDIIRVQEKMGQMWPDTTPAERLELTLSHPDVQNLRENIREEMGLPVDIDPETITDLEASVIRQIDSAVSSFINPLAQQAQAMDRGIHNAVAVQDGNRRANINEAWDFSITETMQDHGQIDQRLKTRMNRHLHVERGRIRIAAGLAGFADIDLDNFSVEQLASEREALVNALEQNGLSDGVSLRRDLTINDPELKQQYEEFWFKTTAVDVAWLNQQRSNFAELPDNLIRDVQTLMGRGNENGWNIAAQYVSTLNQDARNEFLQRIGHGEGDGTRMRTALETWMSFQRNTFKDADPLVARDYYLALRNSRAKTTEEMMQIPIDDDGITHEEALVSVLDNAFEQTFAESGGFFRKRQTREDRQITLARIQRAFNPGEWEELQNAITLTFHSKVWDENLGADDQWALSAQEVLGAYRDAGWGFAGDETNARWTRLGNPTDEQGRMIQSLITNTPRFNQVVGQELRTPPTGDDERELLQWRIQNSDFMESFGLVRPDNNLQRMVVESIMDNEENLRHLTEAVDAAGLFRGYRDDIQIVPDVNNRDWDTAIFESEVPIALKVPGRQGEPDRLIRVPNNRWSPDVEAILDRQEEPREMRGGFSQIGVGTLSF